MADHTLNLKFRVQSDDGEFSAIQSRLKEIGREGKNNAALASKAFGELAGVLDGSLAEGASKVSTIFMDLARGGVWGLLSAAAGEAFRFIKQKIEEAREAAAAFSETIRSWFVKGMSDANNAFQQTAGEIDKAIEKARELERVVNGQTAHDATMKVVELELGYIQDSVDGLSEGAKAVREATKNVEVAETKWAATVEQAEQSERTAKEIREGAEQKLAEAKEALATAQAKSAAFENRYSTQGDAWMAQWKSLQDAAGKNVQDLINAGVPAEKAIQSVTDARNELAKFEKEHKAQIESANAVQNELKTAQANVAAAEKAAKSAVEAETSATRKVEEAQAQRALETARAQEKLAEANEKLDAENAALEAERVEAERVAAAEAARADALDQLKELEAECGENIDELIPIIEKYRAQIEKSSDAHGKLFEATEALAAAYGKIKARQEAERARADVKADADKTIAGLDTKIKNAQDRIKAIQEQRAANQRGMEADQKFHGGIGGEGFKYNTNANGDIQNFEQFQRARRYSERQQREDRTRQQGENITRQREARAEEIAKRLREGKDVSKRDKKWLDDWNKFKEKGNEKNLEQFIREMEQKKKETLESMKTKLASIDENLKKALAVK